MLPRALIAVLLVGIPPVFAQQSQDQKIERILELTKANAVVTEIVSQVTGWMEQIQPNPTPQQKARRQEALDKIAKVAGERMRKIRPELVKIYAETFSPEEIDGILAFYETPAGQASLTKIPAINAKLSALVQIEMDAVGQEINKIAEDALKK